MNAFQWNDRLCIPPAPTASSIASPFVVNLLISNDCELDKDLWLVAIVTRFTLFSFIFDAFYTCLMLREEDVPTRLLSVDYFERISACWSGS